MLYASVPYAYCSLLRYTCLHTASLLAKSSGGCRAATVIPLRAGKVTMARPAAGTSWPVSKFVTVRALFRDLTLVVRGLGRPMLRRQFHLSQEPQQLKPNMPANRPGQRRRSPRNRPEPQSSREERDVHLCRVDERENGPQRIEWRRGTAGLTP
jgi:hypothetical protein